jgi:hypothetical protein
MSAGAPAARPGTQLLQLGPELLAAILGHLPSAADVSRARLACGAMRQAADGAHTGVITLPGYDAGLSSFECDTSLSAWSDLSDIYHLARKAARWPRAAGARFSVSDGTSSIADILWGTLPKCEPPRARSIHAARCRPPPRAHLEQAAAQQRRARHRPCAPHAAPPSSRPHRAPLPAASRGPAGPGRGLRSTRSGSASGAAGGS